jgi:hypothetical protein
MKKDNYAMGLFFMVAVTFVSALIALGMVCGVAALYIKKGIAAYHLHNLKNMYGVDK